jgi:hypothetical protein
MGIKISIELPLIEKILKLRNFEFSQILLNNFLFSLKDFGAKCFG